MRPGDPGSAIRSFAISPEEAYGFQVSWNVCAAESARDDVIRERVAHVTTRAFTACETVSTVGQDRLPALACVWADDGCPQTQAGRDAYFVVAEAKAEAGRGQRVQPRARAGVADGPKASEGALGGTVPKHGGLRLAPGIIPRTL